MNKFDYIIIGAGCSGLSLLYEMNKNNILQNKTCAIFDKRKNFNKDKIWSYWNVFEHSFNDCLIDKWNKISIRYNSEEIILDCNNFEYHSIDSGKFYNKVLDNVSSNKNISFFLDHSIDKISESNNEVIVQTKNQTFYTNLVFDSSLEDNNTKEAHIYQHFYGCEINFEEPVNISKYPTLMDFNCDQKGWIHFMYTLPINEKKMFIETTWISDQKNFGKDQYISEINKYIRNNLNYQKKFKIEYSEIGSIPMFHFNNEVKHKNIIKIGTAANLTRRSTGYTFLNIQKFTKLLINRLKKNKVITNNKRNKKYDFLDKIFIKVLLDEKENMRKIFFGLFKHNKARDIINFLSNNSSIYTDLKIILSMPKILFIKKLLNI